MYPAEPPTDTRKSTLFVYLSTILVPQISVLNFPVVGEDRAQDFSPEMEAGGGGIDDEEDLEVYVQELLQNKLDEGKITQAEFDQIQLTRRTAFGLIAPDSGVDINGISEHSGSPQPIVLAPTVPETPGAGPAVEKIAGTIEAAEAESDDAAVTASRNGRNIPKKKKKKFWQFGKGSKGCVHQTTREVSGPREVRVETVLGPNKTAATSAELLEMQRLEAVEREKLEANFKRRSMIVNEIVETERSYVASLRMLIDVFVLPLRAAAERNKKNPDACPEFPLLGEMPPLEFYEDGTTPRVAIDKVQVKAIFHEVESLCAVNSLLLQELEAKFETWSMTTTIGDVFLSLMSFLRGYTSFANNFDHALSTIDACKKQPFFTEYLTHCVEVKEECNKMWLVDHMITPIQRIPRYTLLLTDLLKYTTKGHPDFDALSRCVTQMTDLAQHINTMKKNAEAAVKMVELQNSIKRCPLIVSAGRNLVLEVVCFEMIPNNSQAAKNVVDIGMQTTSDTGSDARDSKQDLFSDCEDGHSSKAAANSTLRPEKTEGHSDSNHRESYMGITPSISTDNSVFIGVQESAPPQDTAATIAGDEKGTVKDGTTKESCTSESVAAEAYALFKIDVLEGMDDVGGGDDAAQRLADESGLKFSEGTEVMLYLFNNCIRQSAPLYWKFV